MVSDDEKKSGGEKTASAGNDGISRQPTREAGIGGKATIVDDLDVEARIEAAVSKVAHDSDQDRDPLIGKLIDNRFEVLSRLGAGGMGVVYRARQVGIDRIVAIKTLLKDRAQDGKVVMRFKNEARAVSRLNHPNTIRIHDFGQMDDGTLYFAMELLEGRPLDRAIRQDGAFSARRSLHVMIQMADSLAEAHSKGIVHRDLKPENVYLCPIGDDPDFVKVLDFGVARMKEQDHSQGTMTQAGVIFGTPRYMAPEQARTMAVDARADIYALGVIWFEMLTGRTPFDADNPLAILMKHIQDEVPSLGVVRPDLSVPAEVESMVLKCLEKSPDKRFQSAAALAAEARSLNDRLDGRFERVVFVDKAAGVAPASVAPAGRDAGAIDVLPEEIRPATRRRPVVLAVTVAVMAVLGTGIGIGLATMNREKPVVAVTQKAEPPPEPSVPAPEPEPVVAPDVVTAVAAVDVVVDEGTATRMVKVHLQSEPAGAMVVLEDVELGRTPLDVELPAGSEESIFRFVLAGFEDIDVTAILEKEMTVSGVMTAVKPEISPRAAPKKAARKKTIRREPQKKVEARVAPPAPPAPAKEVPEPAKPAPAFQKIGDTKPVRKAPAKVGDLKKF